MEKRTGTSFAAFFDRVKSEFSTPNAALYEPIQISLKALYFQSKTAKSAGI